jgi:hypothetical protein
MIRTNLKKLNGTLKERLTFFDVFKQDVQVVQKLPWPQLGRIDALNQTKMNNVLE